MKDKECTEYSLPTGQDVTFGGLETVDRTWIMAGMATAEYTDPSFLLARGCAISGIAVLG